MVLPPSAMLVAQVTPSGADAKPGNCNVEVLDSIPSNVVRDLGTIELAGTLPADGDVLAAVKPSACAGGADAIVLKKRDQREAGDRIEYHVIAEALLTHSIAPTATPDPQASATPAGPADSTGASASSDAIANVTPTPSAPEETLMQPMAGDDSDADGSAGRPDKVSPAAMSESDIPGTDAAPLTPQPTPTASPFILPLPTDSPTSSASSTIEMTPTPTPSTSPMPLTPTPFSTTTPAADQGTVDAGNSEEKPATPTMTPSAAPTMTDTPAIAPSVVATLIDTATITPTTAPATTDTAVMTPTATQTVAEAPAVSPTAAPTTTPTN